MTWEYSFAQNMYDKYTFSSFAQNMYEKYTFSSRLDKFGKGCYNTLKTDF